MPNIGFGIEGNFEVTPTFHHQTQMKNFRVSARAFPGAGYFLNAAYPIVPIYFSRFYSALFEDGDYLNGLIYLYHDKANIEHTFDKSKSGVKRCEQRAESREQRAESREQRAESRELKQLTNKKSLRAERGNLQITLPCLLVGTARERSDRSNLINRAISRDCSVI